MTHEARQVELRLDLESARRRHRLVRVERTIVGADVIDGYVVDLGTTWVLLSVLSNGATNGWVAVTISDIGSVQQAAGERFVRRTLEFQRRWPASAPERALALSGHAGALVESAASVFDLVTVYLERLDPLSCVIGRPMSSTRSCLHWQQMTPDASWDEELTHYDVSDITRVDIGGQYESALIEVARLRTMKGGQLSDTPSTPNEQD